MSNRCEKFIDSTSRYVISGVLPSCGSGWSLRICLNGWLLEYGLDGRRIGRPVFLGTHWAVRIPGSGLGKSDLSRTACGFLGSLRYPRSSYIPPPRKQSREDALGMARVLDGSVRVVGGRLVRSLGFERWTLSLGKPVR